MLERTVKRHAASRVPVMLLLVLVASTLVCIKTVPVEAQSGRVIDVFTQKGGTGANQSSDMFQPQELVMLHALVTYNDYPVANKLVSFHVNGPQNTFENMTVAGSSTTNESGIAEFSFRIPWPSKNPEKKVFGEWHVVATVDIADQTVVDTLTFQVGWIIKITNIATLNAEWKPQENYLRQSTIVFDLTVENSARTAKTATITIDAQDSASYPIIHIQLDNLVFQPGASHVNASAGIPADASIGKATASAAAYTAPVERGGVLYSPAISTTFEIIPGAPLTYPVTFAQTGLDSTATGTVVTVNGTSKGFADLPFTVWTDSGLSLTYSYGNVSSSGIGKRFVLTGVVGLSSPMTVTGAVNVTGTYGIQYQVTFSQSGVATDFTGTVVTVDSVNNTVSGLPVSFWWDRGSSHSFSFASPLLVDGKQYVWSSTSGLSTLQSGTLTVTASGSVLGDYVVLVPLLTIPPWLILALLVWLVLVGALVLLWFLLFLGIKRRRRRKKSARHSYVIIAHPHV